MGAAARFMQHKHYSDRPLAAFGTDSLRRTQWGVAPLGWHAAALSGGVAMHEWRLRRSLPFHSLCQQLRCRCEWGPHLGRVFLAVIVLCVCVFSGPCCARRRRQRT